MADEEEDQKPEDVGDEGQVKSKKKRAALAREQEVEELFAILETYGGRALIWRILSECAVHHSLPHDMVEAYRKTGGQDIGIWLENEVFTSHANSYTLMREEAIERGILLKGRK